MAMFKYYVWLASKSIRRNPLLSALMVLAIAVGIGASMTTITVNYLMSADPIPQKSDVLYHVQVDNWDPNEAYQEPNEPPNLMTYLDARALMQAGRAQRQEASFSAGLVVEPEGDEQTPFNVNARATFADFFAMFDTPFLYGGAWDPGADRQAEAVVILNREMNEKIFAGENSVGRRLRMSGRDFRVSGVLDQWEPIPRVYDVANGPFNRPEDVFIPFNLAVDQKLSRNGNTSCWKSPKGDGFAAFLNSECVWISMWVELPDADASNDYATFLGDYVTEQKKLGRFPRPLNNHLRKVMDWLENQEVVADDAQVMLWLSLMFLVVCLLNTIGLLLTKFLGRGGEIALRRALGASRRALFMQHLVEASLIGLAGGLAGLGLSWLGLQGVDSMYGEFVRNLTDMDWVMVLAAMALGVVSAVTAGLYPTYRACRIAPAAELKTQ